MKPGVECSSTLMPFTLIPMWLKTFVIHISVRLLYKQMSKPANLLTPGIHPDVNVTWCPSRWIWVHRGIPLPLQYAARISGSLHLIIYIHRSHVQPLIALQKSLAHAKPSHQQYKVRSYILRQLLNTIEDNSDKRLFLCKFIKGGPIKAFQCRPIKKLLSLRKRPKRTVRNENKRKSCNLTILYYSFVMFQRKRALPMMYRRHIRFGSFSRR